MALMAQLEVMEKNGSDGNSHLSNITSIGVNGKSGQLEIVIGRSTL